MFKNLKNRLDNEAEKIKQSVQQYGGQIRQAMNEGGTGSETGASISRRFLSSVTGSPVSAEKNEAEGNGNEDMEGSSSAIMSEIPEADLLGLGISTDSPSALRKRSDSISSNQSNENTLVSLLQSFPNMITSTLDTIPSDSESVASDAFSVRSTNEPAYNSRLKQRLSTYKAKYRDAVHRHNKLVDDVNNTKKLLEETQDEYLKKVEKLRIEKRVLAEKLRDSPDFEKKCEDYKKMLEQCKMKIKSLQEKKESLISVNDDDEDPKIVELYERISKVEDEWTKRMNDSDQQHAISLATTKAEMHAALENKDSEIEQWRRKCSVLEQQDADANQRWQQKVEKLQEMNKALEAEKNEMIEKLSEAKQQGVKAILEEEQRRRNELETSLNEREMQLTEEMEKLKEENEKLCLEMHGYKVQLEAQTAKEFDENQEDIETIQLVLTKTTEERENIKNSFEAYQLEAERTLATAKEQLELCRAECEGWREKYEQQSLDADRISIYEFETNEVETRTREQFEEMRKLANDFEEQKAEIERKCKELEEKVEELTKQKDEMASDKEEMLEKFTKLRNELENTKQFREDIEKRFGEVTEEAEKLKVEIEDNRKVYEKETTELRSSLESADREKFVEERDSLKLEVEEMKKKEVERNEEAVKIRKDLEESEEKLTAVRKELEELKDEVRNERNTEMMQKEESVVISEYKLQLEALKTEKESLQKALEEEKLNIQKTADKEKLARDETEKALGEEISVLAASIQQIEKVKEVEIEELKSKIKVLEEENGKMRKNGEKGEENEEKIEKLETTLLQSGQEMANLREKSAEELKKREMEYQERIKELERIVEKAGLENDEELKKMQDRLEELEEVGRKEVEYQGKIQDLETSLKEAGLEAGKKEEELALLRQRLSGIEECSGERLKKETELQEKISELEDVLAKTNENLEKMKEELIEKDEEIEILKKDSGEEIKRKEDEYRERIDQLEASVNKERRNGEKVAALQDKVSELQNSLEQVNKDLENKREELKQMKSVEEGAADELKKQEELGKQIEQLMTREEELILEVKKFEDDAVKQARVIEEELKKKEELQCQLEDVTRKESECQVQIRNLEKEIEGFKRIRIEADSTVELLKEEIGGLKNAIRQGEQERAKVEEKTRDEFGKELDELRDLNEKMRLEFLAKEKVIADLREELRKGGEEMVVLKAIIEKKETEYGELKSKAEKKLAKMKESVGKVGELETRIDELMSEKDCMKEKAEKLEELEKEREQLKLRIGEQEEDLKDGEHLREKLENQIEEAKKKIEVLEEDVKRLTAANETKAVKQDSDAKKVVRELQKEVKQLYVELNERNQQFDVLKDELEKAQNEPKSQSVNGKVQEEEDRRSDFSYKEEIASLKQKLDASLNEADKLRMHVGRQQMQPVRSSGPQHEIHGIADPAEAEYLRNVLYRYMTTREELGKESVTLARVIGTVARFDDTQMQQVISSEEARQASWTAAVGGTVSHALAR